MRAQHRRLAHNEAKRNDSPPSATNISSRVALGVALGVQRDVPGERRVLGARVLALSWARPPVFRTTPCWLHFAGPPGHRGSRRAESSKPRRGRSAWRRGPTDRVALPGSLTVGRQMQPTSVVRRMESTPCAMPARSLSFLWRPSGGARGRDVLASDGRVRRGPSPGGGGAGGGRRLRSGGRGQADFGGGLSAGVSQRSLMRGLPADGTLRKLPLSWRRGCLSSPTQDGGM
jgi:hypothetical protein